MCYWRDGFFFVTLISLLHPITYSIHYVTKIYLWFLSNALKLVLKFNSTIIITEIEIAAGSIKVKLWNHLAIGIS